MIMFLWLQPGVERASLLASIGLRFWIFEAAQPEVPPKILRYLALSPGRWWHSEPLTFTCVPPGDGLRIALDRDLNGDLDGDELLAGTEPVDANSAP
jgi:hypothetical protein